MARPVTFTEIDRMPDVLSTNRHKIVFPDVPGMSGEPLTLRNTSVTLPTTSIAQIPVRYLGTQVSFKGGSTSEHVLGTEFYETSDGAVLNGLNSWMNVVHNKKTTGGGYKVEYARRAELHVFDTTGVATHIFSLLGVWPMSVSYPQFGQDSGPFQVTAQFSVDAVDLNASKYLMSASTGTTRTNQTFGNPSSMTNFGSMSSVFNMSNNSLLGVGSYATSGLGVSGTIGFGAFRVNFGALFSF